MNYYAPIVLFVYNRPLHTKRTMDALAMNKEATESELYVFCDGPKSGISETEKQLIDEVRYAVRNETRFKNVFITEHGINNGLAKSIVQGVSSVLKQYERVIVLEDDLVVAESFLSYMNEALEKYKDNSQVACISGYVYPLRKKFTEAFFIRGADCWGWATWKDKWELFNNEPEILLAQIKEQKSEKTFDFNNSYPYIQMLEDRINGKNQSWAVLWYASAFVKNKLCLYPSVSLVENIGNDGSGTHFNGTSKVFLGNVISGAKKIVLPTTIEENTVARLEFGVFLKTLNPSWIDTNIRKVKDRIKRLLGVK